MKNALMFCVLTALCCSANASTWSDIAALDAAKHSQKTAQAVSAKAVTQARWYSLSDGRRVDLNHWKIVLFMQSSCSYCHRFDPMLSQFSQESGLPVFPYTIDGKGDDTYPDALPAPEPVMVDYFQDGMPVATPTTFLVNVNTLAAFPLLQGAVEKPALISRLDDVFQIALNGGQK